MKMSFALSSLMLAVTAAQNAALAHDALVPHGHPHAASMIPGVELVAAAALVLALAAAAFVYVKRR